MFYHTSITPVPSQFQICHFIQENVSSGLYEARKWTILLTALAMCQLIWRRHFTYFFLAVLNFKDSGLQCRRAHYNVCPPHLYMKDAEELMSCVL